MVHRRINNFLTSWPVFLLSICWLYLFLTTQTGQTIRGQIRPVTTPLIIESISEAEINGREASRITGTATKKRNCDYVDIIWNYSEEGRSTQVEAVFYDPPEIRNRGELHWSALIVGVRPDQIESTYSEVRHDCGLFNVITHFYRGSEVQ